MNIKTMKGKLAFGFAVGLAVSSSFAENFYLNVNEVSNGDMGAFTSEAENWQTADGGAATAPADDNGKDDYFAGQGKGLGLSPDTKGVGQDGGKNYTLAQRTFGGKSFTLDYDNAKLINGAYCFNNEEEVAFEAGDGKAFYAAVFPNDGLILKRGVLLGNWNRWSTAYVIIGGKVSVQTSADDPITTDSCQEPAVGTAFYEYRFLGEVSGDENAHMKVRYQEGRVPFHIACTNAIRYTGIFTAEGAGNAVIINAARLKALNLSQGGRFTVKGSEAGHTVGDLTVDNGLITFPRKNSGFTVTNSFSLATSLTLDASSMSVTQDDGTILLLKLADGVAGDLTSDLVTVTLPTPTDGSAWAVSRTAKEIAVYPLTIPASTTIAYDKASNTATPVDWSDKPAAEWAAIAKPYAVTLSDALAFTDTENRLAVFKFSSDVNVQVSDFTINTPKTCDLPNAWIETDTVGDVTTVYLVARAVVTKDISSLSGKFQMYSAEWSDGLAPHAGADYYILDAESNVKDVIDQGGDAFGYVFPGESLTLNGPVALYLSDSAYMKVNLRVYNAAHNNCGVFGHGGDVAVLDGSVYLDSSVAGQSFPFKDNGATPFVLRSAFSGSGSRRLRQTWSSSKDAHFALEGDCSAHTGKLQIEGGSTIDVDVTVTRSESFGGALASMNNLGVELDGFVKLVFTNDVDYATENRAIYAPQGTRIVVGKDATFTLRQNYNTMADDTPAYFGKYVGIEKTGAGTFAFAGQLKGWSNWHCIEEKYNGTNNLIRVKEGAIKPLSTDGFDKTVFDFADGTAIKIDASNEATEDYGLRLLNYVPTFASGAKVKLVAEGVSAAGKSFAVNFLTVPSETPDLTECLTASLVKTADATYHGKITKEDITIDSKEYTRYGAYYSKRGLLIIVW